MAKETIGTIPCGIEFSHFARVTGLCERVDCDKKADYVVLLAEPMKIKDGDEETGLFLCNDHLPEFKSFKVCGTIIPIQNDCQEKGCKKKTEDILCWKSGGHCGAFFVCAKHAYDLYDSFLTFFSQSKKQLAQALRERE